MAKEMYFKNAVKKIKKDSSSTSDDSFYSAVEDIRKKNNARQDGIYSTGDSHYRDSVEKKSSMLSNGYSISDYQNAAQKVANTSNWFQQGDSRSTKDLVNTARSNTSSYDNETVRLAKQYINAKNKQKENANLSISSMIGGVHVDTDSNRIASQTHRAAERAKEALRSKGYSNEEINSIIDSVSRAENADRTDSERARIDEEIKNGNFGTQAKYFAKDVASFPIAGIQAASSSIDAKLRDEKVDVNSPEFDLLNRNRQIEQSQSEKLKTNVDSYAGEDSFAGKAAVFGYNVANSTAKSLMSMATGAGVTSLLGVEGAAATAIANMVTLPQFGTSAFAEGIIEGQERGLSDRQTYTLATVSGIAEMLTEVVSLDYLWDIAKKSGKAATRSALVNALVGAGIEGSEEAINDFINEYTDRLISADRSKYQQRINDYLDDNGGDLEKAKHDAQFDFLKEVGMDFLAGVVSGGASAGLVNGVSASVGAGADTYAGISLARNNDKLNTLMTGISENRSDYSTDEAFNKAQQTKKTALKVYNDTKGQKRTSVKDAYSLGKGMREAFGDRYSDATPAEYRTARQSDEKAIEAIKNATDAKEYVTAVESANLESAAVQQAIKETETNFSAETKDAVVTPERAYKLASEGKELTAAQQEFVKVQPEVAQKTINEAMQSAKNKRYIEENANAAIDQKSKEAFTIDSIDDNGNAIDSSGNIHDSFTMSPSLRVAYYFAINDGYNQEQRNLLLDATKANKKVTKAQMMLAVNRVTRDGQLGTTTWAETKKNIQELLADKKVGTYKFNIDALKPLFDSLVEESKTADSQKEAGTVKENTGKIEEAVKEALKEQNEGLYALTEALAKRFKVDVKAIAEGRADIDFGAGEVGLNVKTADEAFASLLHEFIGENLQKNNAAEFKTIQDDILRYLKETISSTEFDNLIRAYQRTYRENAAAGSVDENKSYREAANEMVNDVIFTLFKSEQGLNDLINWSAKGMEVEEQKTFLESMKTMFDSFIDYIKNFIKTGHFNAAEKAALEMEADKAAELRSRILQALDNITVQETEGESIRNSKAVKIMSNAELFGESIDYWVKNGMEDDIEFSIGSTGEVLQGLGAMESDIYMLGDKIKTILNDHPEMTLDEIKKIPKILDNPYMIIASRNVNRGTKNNTRLVLFGPMKAQANKKPIMVVLDLKPVEDNLVIEDMQKISSSYTKTNQPVDFVKRSDLLYLDEKKAASLLQSIGFQMPIKWNESGYIGNISYPNRKVNISGKEFTKVVKSLKVLDENYDTNGRKLSEGQQEYFQDSKIVDENGNLQVVYHGTPTGGFTEFKHSLNYFTTNKEYADRYQTPSASSVRGYAVEATNPQTYEMYLNITKPFDLSDPETRDIFVNEYVNKYSLSSYTQKRIEEEIKNGISWEEADNLLEFIEDMEYDYDGLILNEGGDLTDNGTEYRGLSYVTFRSNQAKNVTNENPTDNPDIRKSIRVLGESSPYYDTIMEADTISSVLSSINSKMKGVKFSEKTLIRTYEKIFDKYKVTDAAVQEEAAYDVYKVFDYMTENEAVDYTIVMDYLMQIGHEVIEHSNMTDPQQEQIYADMKKALSSHNIKLSATEKKELTHYYGGKLITAYGNMKKYGIKTSKDGQSLDGSTFEEIADEFLKIAGVKIDTSIPDGDQMITIIETMEALKPSIINFEGVSENDLALMVASDIIEGVYSQAADLIKAQTDKEAIRREVLKETAKLRKEVETYKEEKDRAYKEATQKYREKLKLESDRISARRQELALDKKQIAATARVEATKRLNSMKESEAKAKSKDQIVRTCTRLINWMKNPTDNQHVPEFMKGPLSELIDAINFMPASLKANPDSQTQAAIKWQTSMRRLQKVIEDIKNAGNNTEETDDLARKQMYSLSLVMEAENLFAEMDKFISENSGIVSVSNLDAQSMKELARMLNTISNAINKMNSTYKNRRFEKMDDLGNTSISEMRELKPVFDSTKNPVKPVAHEFFNLSMLEPITFFEELGDAAASIMQEFFDGEKIGIEIVRESENHFADIHEKLGVSVKDTGAWAKELHEFTIEGQKITLTTTDLMSLYASNKEETLARNEDPDKATYHIMAGGIKASKRKIGNKTINYNPTVLHPSQKQVEDMVNTLTDTQKEYVDLVVDYLSVNIASHGNEVSDEMYGYSKFNGNYYFPLKTDSDTVMTNEANSATAQAGLRSLINPSFTKARMNVADNPLVVMDFFDVVTDHIMGMANYCAYAEPVSDALRWYNFASTTRDIKKTNSDNKEWTRDTQTVKAMMKRAKGGNATRYFEQLIRDINLENNVRGSVMQDKLIGMYKAQAVAGNLRVVIQQPAAAARALMHIEQKYLLKGIAYTSAHLKTAVETAQKNNHLCYWKSKGFSDTRIAQGMKEIIVGYASPVQGIVEKTGILAGIADDVTWAAMYKAAEYKVMDTQPDLKPDTVEYQEAIDEIFSDIINHTQVIDSTLRKTEENRNKNGLVKIANAFQNEPQKTYNMLHRAFDKLNNAKTKEQKDAAAKVISKTLTIYTYAAIVTAIAQSIADASRDDDDDKWFEKFLNALLPVEAANTIKDIIEDDSKTFTAKTALEIYGQLGNILDNLNPINLLPYFTEISSIAKGYDSTRMDTAVFTQFGQMLEKIENRSTTPYGKTQAIAKVVSMATGIPFSNIIREFKVINNNFYELWDGKKWYTSSSTEKAAQKSKLEKSLNEAVEAADYDSLVAAADDIYKYKLDYYMSQGKTDEEAKKSAKTEASKLVTNEYKLKYLALSKTDKTAARKLRSELIVLYKRFGYSEKDAVSKIDKWKE